jgi:hypothetical protein
MENGVKNLIGSEAHSQNLAIYFFDKSYLLNILVADLSLREENTSKRMLLIMENNIKSAYNGHHAARENLY